MALVRWRRRWPHYWPSVLDEDWNWPELSSNGGTGLNIYETDDAVVVEAAVPGIPEEKVEVTLEGNILTIRASHEETEEEKKKKKTVYKSSRKASFSYSTSLPRMVDAGKADAEVENGVVTVTIPRIEKEKPKRVSVKKKKKK